MPEPSSNQWLQQEEERMQIWCLAGPVLLLLCCAVSLFQARFDYSHLPVIACVGLAICWRWKQVGLLGCLICLILISGYLLTVVEIEERFWLLGMSMAIALGLIVTTLSLEEATALVASLRVESNSRLENLWRVDEKLKAAQRHWHSERTGLMEQVSQLSSQLQEKELLVERWQKVVSLVRQDLDATHSSQEALLEELYQARCQLKEQTPVQSKEPSPRERQLVAKLNQARCEKYQLTLDLHALDIATPKPERTAHELTIWRRLRHSQSALRQLREQFEEKSELLDATRRQLFHAQEELLAKEEGSQAMIPLKEVESLLDRHLQPDSEDLQAEVEELQELVDSLLQELAQ